MGYQALIVEACMEYGSKTWLDYDHRLCQIAAASSSTQWAKIDLTFWPSQGRQKHATVTIASAWLNRPRSVIGPPLCHALIQNRHLTPPAQEALSSLVLCKYVTLGITALILTAPIRITSISTSVSIAH